MKNNWIWAAIVLMVIAAGWYYFSKPKPAAGEPIKIGISTIMTGDFGQLGENIVNSAKLAVEDVNNSGGINGRQLELVVEDAGLDSATGLSAAQKLINADGVKYIVGGTTSNGTLAAAPVVNQDKVIYMTPVTGGNNVDGAGEYVFRTANSDILAGKYLADAMIKLGFTKVAAVSEVTEYTQDIYQEFLTRIAEDGGTVVYKEEFQPNTSDFKTIVAKTAAAHPQAILILSQTGISGAYFIKQAKEQGIAAPFFSDFTFVANDNARQVVGSFDGLYFADPAYDAAGSAFIALAARYQKAYGYAPTIPFHTAATYDDVTLLASALRAEGDDSTRVHDWLLSNVKNYHGLMGTYSLDANGNSDLGFVIKVIKNGEAIEVK